ncbi:MBL fold metallo-hydrolase [Devosia sp. BK]|uniref:MBL fold metallo-hydrolase n=1 Tax=Devosia sp. BK TaxID=2871706 RepID=UPI002939CA99|nr:MBL fold metallo-hydrolase [Devosia sp. BK]MDV3253727.1 MBL fold metallo-hydrolase [Devosia sp. BK]
MYEILIHGFPGRTSRGFLGWSTSVLLHTAGGPVLFDTGSSGDRPALLAALENRGVAPGDIGTIVLSHLHFDHIANVECFPNAELVLHQTELMYYYDQRLVDLALPVFQIEGMLARCKLQLIHGEIELFPGVQLLHTPGHTTGHISLALQWAGQTHILAQDAIKHRVDARTGQTSGAHDTAAAVGSIARIMAMADIIVPGHDVPLRISDAGVTPTGPLHTEIASTIDEAVFCLGAP